MFKLMIFFSFHQGARFAQWRCVVRINTKLNQPTELAMINNALTLARFASICQTKGISPIPLSNHSLRVQRSSAYR